MPEGALSAGAAALALCSSLTKGSSVEMLPAHTNSEAEISL